MTEEQITCNRCTKSFDAVLPRDSAFFISADISWGYHSFGKDGAVDRWNLCQSCSIEFRKLVEPICGLCKRTISDIASDLMSKYEGHRFFGDKEGALNYCLNSGPEEWVDVFEYAKVADRIICEPCYDKYTGEFKLSIPHDDYFFKREDQLFQEKNRTNKYLKRKKRSEDSIKIMHRSSIDEWEARAILKSTDRAQRILEIHVNIYKAAGNIEINLISGSREHYTIENSVLDRLARDRGLFYGLSKPSVLNVGLNVSFGGLRLSSKELFDLATKVVEEKDEKWVTAEEIDFLKKYNAERIDQSPQ